MKILFISAEVYPFAKVGGLADVVGSLPKFLSEMGHDVQVVMPAYQAIEQGYAEKKFDIKPLDRVMQVPVESTAVETGMFAGTLPGTDIPIYFIANSAILGRPGVYGYHDDPYRFAYFSKAALQFFVEELEWTPDILHAHDWHTAPAVTWLATAGQTDPRYKDIRSVFTIHNLAHHGKSPWHIFNYMQLHSHSLTEEDYNEVNFMARGIYHSSKINTVSPNYAKEIKTFQGGTGLDGLLRHRGYDLSGILNGLDYEVWDPAADEAIHTKYTVDSLEKRRENKIALQEQLGLAIKPDVPLLGMVTRLDWQKGLDLTGEIIYRLMEGQVGDAQVVVLGSGEPHFQEMLGQFAQRYPSKMSATFEFRPALARQIYAGADMFLMPSLFEPCGLGQLIAMRYGAIPVVRGVGGLADTVADGETGFVFDGFDTTSFWHAIQRASYTYNTDRPFWRTMQRKGMLRDFSWEQSAIEYQRLYQWALD